VNARADATTPDPELDALLGAYALDAVEPEERWRIEVYLASNRRARDEVDELRETAAALALAPVDDISAPPELWTRIVEHIERDEAAVDELSVRGATRARGSRSSRATGVLSAVAAVAAVMAVVLGVRVATLQGDLDDTRAEVTDLAAAYERATDTTGARAATLTLVGAPDPVARVALLPDGTGYLLADGLPPLSTDRTYQLWAVVESGGDERVISAGVLGPAPRAAAFTVEGEVRQLVLTVEEAGGVVSSEQPAFAAAPV
jgi:hypothetical protein